MKSALISCLGLSIVLTGLLFFVVGKALSIQSVEQLIRGPVTLSSWSEILYKTRNIATKDKKKIALVGDSFVFGEFLNRDHGSNWRTHTLDQHLQSCLSQTGSDIDVYNFGQNGLLPLDMEILSKEVLKFGFDKVIFNINSRSVSDDFNMDETANSRNWINDPKEINVSAIDQLMVKVHLLKKAIFADTPESWGRRVANFLASGIYNIGGAPDSDRETLLKLKLRYRSSTYDETKSRQAAAIGRMLLNEDIYGFITIENPNTFSRIMSRSRQKKLKQQFVELTKNATDKSSLLTTPTDLEIIDYFDLIHVNSSGYAKYAKAICADLVNNRKI